MVAARELAEAPIMFAAVIIPVEASGIERETLVSQAANERRAGSGSQGRTLTRAAGSHVDVRNSGDSRAVDETAMMSGSLVVRGSPVAAFGRFA
jgi:hypothetical protein